MLRHSIRSSAVTDACLIVTPQHQVISSHWWSPHCYVTAPGHKQSLMLASLLRHSTRSSAVTDDRLIVTPQHQVISSHWWSPLCYVTAPGHKGRHTINVIYAMNIICFSLSPRGVISADATMAKTWGSYYRQFETVVNIWVLYWSIPNGHPGMSTPSRTSPHNVSRWDIDQQITW